MYDGDDGIDCSGCKDLERVPGRCGGDWTVIGTRILPGCVTNNMGDASPEEIDEMFPGLGVEPTRRIIAYPRSASYLTITRQFACYRSSAPPLDSLRPARPLVAGIIWARGLLPN